MERLLPIEPGCLCITNCASIRTTHVKAIRLMTKGEKNQFGTVAVDDAWALDKIIFVKRFNKDLPCDSLRERYLIRIDGTPENIEINETEKPVTV